jgi:hypothetical protein
MNLLRRTPILEHQRHRIRVKQRRRNSRPSSNLSPLFVWRFHRCLWLTIPTWLFHIILRGLIPITIRSYARPITIPTIVPISITIAITRFIRIQPAIIVVPRRNSIPIRRSKPKPLASPIQTAVIKTRPYTRHTRSYQPSHRRTRTSARSRPIPRRKRSSLNMPRAHPREPTARTKSRMSTRPTPNPTTPLRTRRSGNHSKPQRNYKQLLHTVSLRPNPTKSFTKHPACA